MKKYICTICSFIYNPFAWEEWVEPGTIFDDIDESWTCPHCGEVKEMFMEVPENIQCISHSQSLTDQEECHIPFYEKSDGKILIQIWTEDNPHPVEDGHFIEYIGLFDEDGEIIDIIFQPKEPKINFIDWGLDFFEVRSSCNVHGTWKWVSLI